MCQNTKKRIEYKKHLEVLAIFAQASVMQTYSSIALEIAIQRKKSNRIPERAAPLGVGFSVLVCGFVANL